MRYLFEYDDGGRLRDVTLLDRLVAEKLKAEAETIAFFLHHDSIPGVGLNERRR
jgi:hypothetical protein